MYLYFLYLYNVSESLFRNQPFWLSVNESECVYSLYGIVRHSEGSKPSVWSQDHHDRMSNSRALSCVFKEIMGTKEKPSCLMPPSDLCPTHAPVRHSRPPPILLLLICWLCLSPHPLAERLYPWALNYPPSPYITLVFYTHVPAHGTLWKRHHSTSNRLLLREDTEVQSFMSNHCSPRSPSSSFFNIQIACFVRLNWRLIAHTIWWRLFKDLGLFFHPLSFSLCLSD